MIVEHFISKFMELALLGFTLDVGTWLQGIAPIQTQEVRQSAF